MMSRGLIVLIGAAFMASGDIGRAQKAPNWRVYRLADGLAESACFSVSITPQGKILARHPNVPFISELDGYAVSVIPTPEEGSGRIYGSPGGQLWTVTSTGLQEFRERAWVLHPVPEIAAGFRSGLPRLLDPVPLYPVRQGLVICLLRDQLIEFNSEDPDHPRTTRLLDVAQTPLQRFTGLTTARDGGLWISGLRGLARASGPVRNLQPDTGWRRDIPPDSIQVQNLVEPHEDQDGGVTTVGESSTNNQKVVVRFDGQAWQVQAAGAEKIRQAWRGEDGSLWACSIDSLIQWQNGRREPVESEEISARQYFDVAVEPNGTFWLATSDGLFRYAPLTWRMPAAVRSVSAPVLCLAGDQERLWLVAGNALHSLQDDRRQEYPLPEALVSNAFSTAALFPLKNGNLLVEAGNQLLQFNPTRGVFASLLGGSRAGRVKPLGLLNDGSLCAQILSSEASHQPYRLETYDGSRFRPFAEALPEATLGNRLHCLFTARNGDLWLSGERGTAWFHDKKWRTFSLADKSVPEAPSCFTELADGKLWCATEDKLWEFDGRNWAVTRSGFDRIYGMSLTRDGSIWIATGSGLHRFTQGAWLENGLDEGLPGLAVRALYEDQRGRLWAGTARGLSRYYPEADPDPPQTYVHKLTDKESTIPEGGTISLTFTGQDKWKYTPRSRLLYAYRLDGRPWSQFAPASMVSFSDLPAGKHYFDVRAVDRNGNVDPQPDRWEFAVILPWYKEPRLLLTSIAGLAVALFFAAVAFNRHRQLLLSYAAVEKKVKERTRELEVANRALVHSQKMNALGALAAGIAHDFNNILSIIKGSAQIIEDNLDNPKKVGIRVDRINTAVDQGAGIVKAMLGFSRESEQQAGPCRINTVVDETLKLLGDRFLREVQVKFVPALDLPVVLCSKDFVQQILLNFIFNAAESMNEHRQIFLATRRVDGLPPAVVLAPASAERYVSISVRDLGCGISPEIMPRIFEPFFTTKALSARRGTGLGLSMVYELAKKMEAGLAVESAVSQGSTFTLILPVRAASDSMPEVP